ncbi:hypothetical protein RSW44_23350 [Escherichia coli]|uniref:hypothetical protein n=1 Tax=Escherichia coli TaxID=562 RepID=UPI0028DF1D08|nr:hypothetical protein [Escherichia coli]MDT9115513.1 hypothetical protein [Escherichia coli]
MKKTPELQQMLQQIVDARTRKERWDIGLAAARSVYNHNDATGDRTDCRELVRAIYDAFKTGHQSYRLTKDDAWHVVLQATVLAYSDYMTLAGAKVGGVA